MITDEFLATLRRVSAGFPGTFVFDPEHEEDLGIGAPEVVEFEDRLMYVPDGADLRDEDCCVVSNDLDEHVARAIATLLNAVPALIAEVDRLRAISPRRAQTPLVRVVSPRRDHRYEGVVACLDHFHQLEIEAPVEAVSGQAERCLMCGVPEARDRRCQNDGCARALHPQWPAVYCCNGCALEDL